MMIKVDDGSTVTTKDCNGEASLNFWGGVTTTINCNEQGKKTITALFRDKGIRAPALATSRTRSHFWRPWPLPLQLEDHVVVPAPLELRHSAQSVILFHERDEGKSPALDRLLLVLRYVHHYVHATYEPEWLEQHPQVEFGGILGNVVHAYGVVGTSLRRGNTKG